MKHRVPALVAALALFAMLIPLTTAVVLAWAPPSITSVCSNDPTVNNWTVTLAHESNYNMQWADNAGFSGATDVTMAEGANALSTPSSVTTLYVRWASDYSSSSSATWNGGTCSTPPPTLPPTAPPTAPPTGTPIVTEPPTAPPTGTPTATYCIGNFTGQPAAFVSYPLCQTPFESFQGETATPPPTGTASDSQSSDSTPLFALLISFILGGAGLAAAQLQRRTIRR